MLYIWAPREFNIYECKYSLRMVIGIEFRFKTLTQQSHISDRIKTVFIAPKS